MTWLDRAITIFLAGVVVSTMLGLLCVGYLLWRAAIADPLRSSREPAGPVVAGHGLASSCLDPKRPAAKPSHGVDLSRRAS